MKHFRPGRWTPARGCCNQCVPCTRAQTRTDACKHMHQHANLSPVVSEEPRPHLACQLPQPARITKASFLQCGFQTCSRRSLRPSKKREARPCQPRAPYNTTSKSDKCCAGPIFDVRDGVEEPAWRDIFSQGKVLSFWREVSFVRKASICCRTNHPDTPETLF